MIVSKNRISALAQRSRLSLAASALSLLLLASANLTPKAYAAPEDLPGPGKPVIAANALLTTPVGGMEKTAASSETVRESGTPFSDAIRVSIGSASAETNATQLTIPIAVSIEKGDALLATLYVRGRATGSKAPGQIELLLERATDPWTKSVSQGISCPADPHKWKRVVVPFSAAESYQPGQAMVSLRLAFGPQVVEVGGLSVVNFGNSISEGRLFDLAAQQNPFGNAHVAVDRSARQQTLLGFGGDFCQPRYGSTDPMDAVGSYNLAHLHVAQARVGIPLNSWCPKAGIYSDTAQAHAAFLQMQILARRHIPIIGTVWEGPQWLLGGVPEQSNRTLAPERYVDCIEAIAQFLVAARDRYGVTVPNFSFNEPDYGVNFRFTPEQMAQFIALAGPRFRALGLPTRFLVGDTTGGSPIVDYARPLLADSRIAAFLGPIAFHSWDVMDTSEQRYAQIAALGRAFHKPVWCTEAGHDPGLWQKTDAFGSWDNAPRTALAYVKTMRASGAAVMDYWTYEDNYPIVSRDGRKPFPVFDIIQQMGSALAPGSTVVTSTSDNDNLETLAVTGGSRGQFAVVLTNTAGAGTVTISGLPPGIPVAFATQTEAAQASMGRRTLKVDARGRITIPVPTRSVTTVLSTP